MDSGKAPMGMRQLYSSLHFIFFDPRYRQARLAAAIGIYTLIIVLGSVPGGRQEIDNLRSSMGIPCGAFSGWGLHALSYGFIAAMLFGGIDQPAFPRLFQCLAVVVLMGGLDEAVQSFLPYRSGKVADWETDVLWGLISLIILFSIHSFGARRQPPAAREPEGAGIHEQALLLD